jgi:hypothetical protein
MRNLFRGKFTNGVAIVFLILGVVGWFDAGILTNFGIEIDPETTIQLALSALGIRRAIG